MERQPPNFGLCGECRRRVPSEFILRDGQVWIRKHCPDCGTSEALVSNDAEAWQGKRDLWRYVPAERVTCTLQCDRCGVDHEPNIVFVDVTNRCNMHCPIYIATIRGMGFDFNPPLEYFRRVFDHVAGMHPTPMVELFGGEPTVRDDLLEIVGIGKRRGLKPRIVTNGIRLADEDYCRRLCASKVRLRFAFDGRDPEIYERLRRNRPAYAKKMKALENLKRHSVRKHAIVACVARGINDRHVGDLIAFCHENADLISELGLIPLTENWQPGEFEVDRHTTMEDVERIVAASVPDGAVEFIPAGLTNCLRLPRSFLRRRSRSEKLLLGGVHPNCESATLLVSEGAGYRSVNHYLRMPFSRVASDFLARSRAVEPALKRLDPSGPVQRRLGQLLVLKTFGPLVLRMIDFGRLHKRHALATWARILLGLLRGRRFRDLAYRHLNVPRVLRVAVLPFEESHSVDAARMEKCKAVFVYEDVSDGRIKTIPACMWYLYRNPILKRISEHYGVAGEAAEAPAVAAT